MNRPSVEAPMLEGTEKEAAGQRVDSLLDRINAAIAQNVADMRRRARAQRGIEDDFEHGIRVEDDSEE